MEVMKWIIGIDEVGRGPLAGPVSVGVVVCKTALAVIPELNDSKKMTEAARNRVFRIAKRMENEGVISFGTFSTSARTIDAVGIEKSIARCVERGLETLAPVPGAVTVFLDGRVRAPEQYEQQSIIRGDSLIPAISLASVVAKVHRDRYMSRVIEQRHPEYGFIRHKGYGTREHIEALKKFGPSTVHRRSFLGNFFDFGVNI